MKFENVYIAGLGYTLPSKVVSTADVERQLEPVYKRLRLPEGRLELMTGILERRFWPSEMLPSEQSIISGEKAIKASQVAKEDIELLVHCSVCRDQMEPATACRIHQSLGLSAECMVYDTSNACLGMVNGMLQAASLIELGQIKAALVVGTENGAGLVENTINYLNSNKSINRKNIKNIVASLTIGSASSALVLVHKDLAKNQTRLHSVVARAETQHYQLCQGDHDPNDSMNRPLMNTDSEALMHNGVKVGQKTFEKLLEETGWSPKSVDRSICHQVGKAHRSLMLEALGLDPENDFGTFEWLGNTGSCAVPTTLAAAGQLGVLKSKQSVALLGIGSGINCVMAGISWDNPPVLGHSDLLEMIPEHAKAGRHLIGEM